MHDAITATPWYEQFSSRKLFNGRFYQFIPAHLRTIQHNNILTNTASTVTNDGIKYMLDVKLLLRMGLVQQYKTLHIYHSIILYNTCGKGVLN